MTNEVIGIMGAIGLAFLLFALRHLLLSGRHSKRRHAAAIAPRETYEPDKRGIGDDAWLQYVEKEVRVARGQSLEPHEALRKARREDRAIGGEIR